MKFYKRSISLLLVVTLIFSSTTVFAHSEEKIFYEEKLFNEMKSNLEVEKQQILENIYKQLKSQDKENMYYLFEKEVEGELSSILESTFPQEIEKTLDITPLTTVSRQYQFRYGGSVVYTDRFFTTTTVSKIFMTRSQSQDFFNKTKTSSISSLRDFILLWIGGTWGKVFSINSIAQTVINNSAWENIFDGSGRAMIMTIKDPLEGQATVIYEWTSYPTAYIEASEILNVKYGL